MAEDEKSLDVARTSQWSEDEKSKGKARLNLLHGKYNPCARGTKHLHKDREKEIAKLLPSLQGISAMLLMTVLYAARVARYDLFKPINFLAKRMTKWDSKCDRGLHQLMSYINETKDQVMLGYIGENDEMSQLGLHLYCDADFAGDPYTLKSTSGAHMAVEGPNSRFPFSAGVEGQTSRAHSSTEAEVNSLDRGMRDRGDPSFCVWDVVLRQYHQNDDEWRLVINLHEDNIHNNR